MLLALHVTAILVLFIAICATIFAIAILIHTVVSKITTDEDNANLIALIIMGWLVLSATCLGYTFKKCGSLWSCSQDPQNTLHLEDVE